MSQPTWLSNLYQEFRRELFLTAWTVVRRHELAEDSVHDAFANLVKLDTPPVDAKLYVFRSVRNAAIDVARRCRRRYEEPLVADWEAPNPGRSDAEEDTLRAISVLVERLDERSREVIELHLHAGLSFREISEVLDEPLPTVASRYRRALNKLGREIKVPHE